ncbi:hypothetical protein MRY87_04820 [bacterium]|nr:hypothetical protein [bacterium]
MEDAKMGKRYKNGPLCTDMYSGDLINGSLLKPFEESAQSRGLLGDYHTYQFYPLWFHYENERNITLWKQGYSLENLDNCDIWVNPIALLEKVRRRRDGKENPLLNPSHLFPEGAEPSPSADEAGTEYYELLRVLLEKAIPHLHALSCVSAEVLETELSGEHRQQIILAA